MKKYLIGVLTGVITGTLLALLITVLNEKEEEYPNIEIIALPEVTYIDKNNISSVTRNEYFVVKNVPKDLETLKDLIEVYNQGNTITASEGREDYIERVFLRESENVNEEWLKNIQLLTENERGSNNELKVYFEHDGIANLSWRYNSDIDDFELNSYIYFEKDRDGQIKKELAWVKADDDLKDIN